MVQTLVSGEVSVSPAFCFIAPQSSACSIYIIRPHNRCTGTRPERDGDRSGADFCRSALPANRGLYYNGGWHEAKSGRHLAVESPGTGESRGEIADGDATDIAAVVASAKTGFGIWRDVHPLERAAILRQVAEIVRKSARDLAAIDAIDCGNPFTAMINDAAIAASQLDFFAEFVTEMKGHSVPVGTSAINFSIRAPLGIVPQLENEAAFRSWLVRVLIDEALAIRYKDWIESIKSSEPILDSLNFSPTESSPALPTRRG